MCVADLVCTTWHVFYNKVEIIIIRHPRPRLPQLASSKGNSHKPHRLSTLQFVQQSICLFEFILVNVKGIDGNRRTTVASYIKWNITVTKRLLAFSYDF